MDTVEILIIAILGLAVAIGVTWLIMRMIVSGLASRMVGAVRDFIQRATRDRRRIPRDTPDRRNDPVPDPSTTDTEPKSSASAR